MNLSKENQAFIDGVWEKITEKMPEVAKRNIDKIPYTAVEGVFDDRGADNINMWTNGFWPGLMWLMYNSTKNEIFKKAAENAEAMLDKALANTEKLTHDVGFMWAPSAKADYVITGNEQSKRRALTAANSLMGRYNIRGGFIRAWNKWHDVENTHGWTIIDCMMNLPLLYWASDATGDDRFKYVAMSHADMALRDHIRPDGSVYHICQHNPETGEVEGYHLGQGYAVESSWSRGQTWAIYGMSLSYLHTGKKEYLDAAKKVAHYFIANIANTDYVPLVDFRAPSEPVWYDTSAAACAACGFIEIAKHVPELEQGLYINAAIKVLKSLDEKYAVYGKNQDQLLNYGSERYYSHEGTKGKHIPIIYGDMFYAEAIYKLKGFKEIIW